MKNVNIFCYTAAVKIMDFLFNNNVINRKRTYISEISRFCELSYSHTATLISRLEETEFIKYYIIGKKKFIKLTDKGKKLAFYCYKLKQILEEDIILDEEQDKKIQNKLL